MKFNFQPPAGMQSISGGGKTWSVPNGQIHQTASSVPGTGRNIIGTYADSILEGALQIRSDAPYSCMGGACGTCRAKLLDGTVEMDQNFALGRDDLDAGYILTCQSHPTSSAVSVDYDA